MGGLRRGDPRRDRGDHTPAGLRAPRVRAVPMRLPRLNPATWPGHPNRRRGGRSMFHAFTSDGCAIEVNEIPAAARRFRLDELPDGAELLVCRPTRVYDRDGKPVAALLYARADTRPRFFRPEQPLPPGTAAKAVFSTGRDRLLSVLVTQSFLT